MRQTPFKSWKVLLLGVAAPMIFMGVQKTAIPAKEPVQKESPSKAPVQVAPEQLSDHSVGVMPTVKMHLSGKVYILEVATTPDQSARGLMFRDTLAADHGMLFPFVPARRVSFWMKNTRIPLDMVFMRDHKVVNIVHAVPCKEEPCPLYPSVVPVDMVVELPAGTTQALDLALGERVVFSSNQPGVKAEEPELKPLVGPNVMPKNASGPPPVSSPKPVPKPSKETTL